MRFEEEEERTVGRHVKIFQKVVGQCLIYVGTIKLQSHEHDTSPNLAGLEYEKHDRECETIP